MDETYNLYFSYQDSLALHKLFEYLSQNKELILFSLSSSLRRAMDRKCPSSWAKNHHTVSKNLRLSHHRCDAGTLLHYCKWLRPSDCPPSGARGMGQCAPCSFFYPPDFNDDSVLSSGSSGSFSLMNSSTPLSFMKYLLENKTKHLILSV